MGSSYIIIGASHAGVEAAFSLRKAAGATARITLLSAEEAWPYQRPPLSKGVLSGALAPARILLRPKAAYAEADIDLRCGCRVMALEGGVARLADGTQLGYDAALLATGGQARVLAVPGAGLPGVMSLRVLPDARILAAALRAKARVVAVGAGYIGLEIAAAVRAAGGEVCVLEAQPRPLARVAGPFVGAFFAKAHQAMGTRLVTGRGLATLEGRAKLEAVGDDAGARYPADVAVLGVGLVPDVALAAAAGCAIDDGVVVDSQCATSQAGLFACGDVARWYSARFGCWVRLESAPNALDQARVAALAMAGKPGAAYDPVPWFWSDQGKIKLQSAGLAHPDDDEVLRGDPSSGRFAAFRVRQGRLVAVDAVNDPLAFVATRRLLQAGATPDIATLTDPTTDLRTLVCRTH